MRKMLTPRNMSVLPVPGTPMSSPWWVPLAVKTSTTRSPSAISCSTSLCQSGQRLPVLAGREPHPFEPLRRSGERGVVVDEVRVEIAVDGPEVALGEQLLDERLDELLVLGQLVRSHSSDRAPGQGAEPSHHLGISVGATAAHTAGMPRAARLVRAEQDAVRLCHDGLDNSGVRREVLQAVRRMMPVDAAFFATADPDTLLFTGAWAEEPLAAATHLFLDNEFGGDDVNKFAALATSGRHVASLDRRPGVTVAPAPATARSCVRSGSATSCVRPSSRTADAGVICACTVRTSMRASPQPRPPRSPASLHTSPKPCAMPRCCTARPRSPFTRYVRESCCSLRTSAWSPSPPRPSSCCH